MKIKHLLLAAIATIATFAACQEKPEDLGEPNITLGTTELTFDQNGGSQTITLNSTRAWKVKDLADWVVIEPSSGEASKDAQTVTVTVLENTGSNKSCSITFTCGIVSDCLTIKQDGPGGGPVEGDGTKANPYSSSQANLLGAELADGEEMKDVFVSGKVSTIKSIDTSFGNAEYYISDDGTTTDEFYIYRGYSIGGNKFKSDDEIKVGDEVVVYGTIINFKGNTVEMTTGSKIVKLNGEEIMVGPGGNDNVDPITGDNLLTNGSFEDWTSTKPAGWDHSSGNATLNKITDGAKEGSNACEVCGADQNKRLMSKSYTLKPGTYQIQAYIKGEGKYRAGYAKLTKGAVGDSSDYIYLNDAAQAASDWTQHIAQFTLTAETEIAIVFMNHNTGGGKSFIIDDVKLVTNDGGLGDGSGDDGGGTPGPGTFETSAEKPASASAALAYAQTLNASTEVEAYVKGIISQIDEVDDTGKYGNATYYISDDGNTSGQFEIFRGYYIDGEKFTSKDQIKVGDEVIVFGKIVNYKGTTPEMTSGSKIISLNGQGGQGGGDDGGDGGDDGGNIDPSTLTQITCAEFNALAEDNTDYYILEGKVSSIADAAKGAFYIKDDSGENAYIYGLSGKDGEAFSALGISKDDIVRIYGQHTIYIDKYNNDAHVVEMQNAKLISHEKGYGGTVDAVVTLTFPDENSGLNSVSGYDNPWTAKSGDYTFTLTQFNNNKWGNDWKFVRCGRKNGDSTASIASDQAIDAAVSKVVVSFDKIDVSLVKALYLEVASDSAFSNVSEKISVTPEIGDITFAVSSASTGKYYRLVVDCAKGSGNGFVQISKLVFAK